MKRKKLGIYLPKRSSFCFEGGEALKPGMSYFSLVKFSEEALSRRDFCVKCWRFVFSKLDSHEEYSYWRSVIPLKKEEGSLDFAKEEKALNFLKELLAKGTKEKEILAFVLSRYLEKKKKIVVKKEMKEISYYEIPFEEEIIAVKKVNLEGVSIKNLQEKLDKYFYV